MAVMVQLEIVDPARGSDHAHFVLMQSPLAQLVNDTTGLCNFSPLVV